MAVVKVAINLPVKNLEKSFVFFTSLGFGRNEQLSNADGVCIVINDAVSAVLLSEVFFDKISRRQSTNTDQQREVIVQLVVESRARVDDLVDRAIAAGGLPVNEPNDMGFLYGRSFEDLDGHMWDVFHVRG